VILSLRQPTKFPIQAQDVAGGTDESRIYGKRRPDMEVTPSICFPPLLPVTIVTLERLQTNSKLNYTTIDISSTRIGCLQVSQTLGRLACPSPPGTSTPAVTVPPNLPSLSRVVGVGARGRIDADAPYTRLSCCSLFYGSFSWKLTKNKRDNQQSGYAMWLEGRTGVQVGHTLAGFRTQSAQKSPSSGAVDEARQTQKRVKNLFEGGGAPPTLSACSGANGDHRGRQGEAAAQWRSDRMRRDIVCAKIDTAGGHDESLFG